MRSARRGLGAALLATTALALPAASAQAASYTLTTNDAGTVRQGWFTAAGVHNQGNTNTYTGELSGQKYRSFDAFRIAGVTGTVTCATLRTQRYDQSGALTLAIDRVQTPVATLQASQTNRTDVYADLGDEPYGEYSVATGGSNDVVAYALPSSALTAIQSAIGTYVTFGLDVRSPSTGFIYSSSSGTNSLVIGTDGTPCPSSAFTTPVGDTTPPAVTVSAPAVPAGQGGFFRAGQTPVSVSVSATDASGVTALSCTDNGNAVTVQDQSGSAPRTGTVAISGDGDHAVVCRATDAATAPNTGAAPGSANTATVRIDATPPSLTVSDITREAQTPAGADVASYDAVATDANGATVACTPAAPRTFPIGATTVTCTATDTAQNAVSKDITVTVIRTAPALTLEAAIDGQTYTVPTPSLGGTAGTRAKDDPTVTVMIRQGATVVQTLTATVAPDGSYVVTPAALPDGDYTVTATQGDAAGGSATVARSFSVLRPGTGAGGDGGSADGDSLSITKTEDALGLDAGQTRTATLSCPGGGIMSDGSVRIDAVDQGTGTLASVQVLEQRTTAPGTFTFVIRNTATGRAQVKLSGLCLPARSSGGRPLVVGDAKESPAVLLPDAARQTTRVSCANGQIAIAPGFRVTDGVARLVGVRYVADPGSPATPPQRFRTIELAFVADPAPAAVVGSVRCLTATLGSGADTRALALSTRSGSADVAGGSVGSQSVSCADDAKGVVATYALAPGLLFGGGDPQPKTRVFQLVNTTAGGLHADLGLLCFGDRTGGPGTTTALRSARLRSTVARLSATGRTIAAQVTCVRACRGTVTLRLAGSKRIVARGVLRRAARGTSTVKLTVVPGARSAVRRAGRARLTLTAQGRSSVHTVRLRRAR